MPIGFSKRRLLDVVTRILKYGVKKNCYKSLSHRITIHLRLLSRNQLVIRPLFYKLANHKILSSPYMSADSKWKEVSPKEPFYGLGVFVLKLNLKLGIYMYLTLIIIVISLFIAMLFLNIYFRVNVFKQYKYLTQNDIDFGPKHIFDDQKMKKEILPRYPGHEEQILAFTSNLRKSIKMATVLVALITLFGAILMYYRHET